MQKQKYNVRLVSKLKSEQEFDKNQIRLKNQYGISQDKRVVIVEKSNTFKFTIKTLANTIHVIATALLLFLALVGLSALLYPDSRDILWNIAEDVIKQLDDFFPMLELMINTRKMETVIWKI